MSIALSTLVLFFLLIPGIIFRRFYYSEEFSREYFKDTFFGVFISTILPSLFFHFVWYFIVKLFDNEVDLFVLADIVSQQPSIESFINLEENASNILVYNLSLFIISGLTGFSFKKIVRKNKLDRKYKFFRFKNSWHYVLKGEFFDFPRARVSLLDDKVEDIEFIFVDAIIEISGESYLYDGFLVDYELNNKNSGLETISISSAKRRKMKDDRKISKDKGSSDNSDKYYPISGHLLVLKYMEIKNLNFTYFKLDLDKKTNLYTPKMVE